jgi:hypothetical protein
MEHIHILLPPTTARYLGEMERYERQTLLQASILPLIILANPSAEWAIHIEESVSAIADKSFSRSEYEVPF